MQKKSERIKHANAMKLQVTYTPHVAAATGAAATTAAAEQEPSSNGRTQKDYAKLCKNCGRKNPRTLNSSAFYKVKS